MQEMLNYKIMWKNVSVTGMNGPLMVHYVIILFSKLRATIAIVLAAGMF
jgi:hypothetical protein